MARDRLVVRRDDGTVWEPSTPPGYTTGDALAGLLSGKRSWYFMRVVWRPAPWWRFWTGGRWERTGGVWEPESASSFTVVERSAPVLLRVPLSRRADLWDRVAGDLCGVEVEGSSADLELNLLHLVRRGLRRAARLEREVLIRPWGDPPV